MADGRRLIDVGERHLIDHELRARYGDQQGFGDDCAVLEVPSKASTLVWTTDPAPLPVAHTLGYDDYYYWGWLLAAINWSDIAAAGGSPVGLLTSLTLPNEFSLSD